LKHLSVRFVLALAFIFSLALHYVGSAYAQSNVSVEVDPAFDGSYSSLWGVAPVRLRVSNQGQSFVGRVELIVSQSAGNLVYTTEMDLPQGSSKEVVFYPSMIGTSVTLRARVLNGTQTLAEASAQASSLGSSQYLVGVIVPSADSYLRLENRQLGDINVVQIEPRDLPDRSLALGSLDALVLDGSVATDLSPQQVEALRSWVNSGGTLLLVGELSALGDVMPVRLKGGSTSADVEDLASLSRTSTSPGRAQVLAADLVSGARVIAGSASTPLVAERSFGEGRAIWLAWNPTEEPFSTWQGTPRILARLLASSPHKANDALFLSSWEINQFVQNIPGLGLPSTWALIGFLGVYVVLIGPVLYFLLKRTDRRELAWVLIPAISLVFSVVAYAGGSATRGRATTIKSLEVVQANAGSRYEQVMLNFGIFSPVRKNYDIALDSSLLPMWQVAGASSLGTSDNAISTRGYTVEFDQGSYVVSDAFVDVYSFKSWAAVGARVADRPMVETDLRFNGGTMSGEIANHSQYPIEEAFVFHNGRWFRVGTIDKQSVRRVSNVDSSTVIWENTSPDATNDFRRTAITESVVSPTTPAPSDSSVRPLVPGTDTVLIGWQKNVPAMVGLRNQGARIYTDRLVVIRIPSDQSSQSTPGTSSRGDDNLLSSYLGGRTNA